MGLFKGGAIRLLETALYGLLFCCAGIILGIYSYFLATLADRDVLIPTWEKAVEGLSGAAVVYLIFAVLLTCCFGGISVLAFLAIVLDILFCGAMIAIAVMTRHGASSCKGNVRTPLGNGVSGSGTGGFGKGGFGASDNNSSNVTYSVNLRTACKLNTAVFAVSIIAAFLFLITAAMQLLLIRNHKKEKRYGPSPSNNYTSGYGKKRGFFGRKNKNTSATKDAELGAVGAGATGATAGGLAATHHDTRPSNATGYTGSTAADTGAAPYDKIDPHNGHAPHGAHGGYYTQPQGTGVNPYGYEGQQPTYTTGTATNY